VFGDSFFFGIELDLPQTYEGQLEKRLRDAGYRAEVMNFAVGGFGTAEMLQTYTGFGRRFQPDVVIFSWDDSDLQDNVRSGLFRLEDGRLQPGNAEYLPGVKTSDWLMHYGLYRLIADHSEFYSFIRERTELMVKRYLRKASKDKAEAAEAAAAAAEPASVGGEAAPDTADAAHRSAAVDLAAALLLRANQIVKANGADFLLVEIPFKLSRTSFRPSVDALPEAVRSQIKVVDTTSALLGAARPDLELFYETGQGHLTPFGESILVDRTLRALATSPQLAACRSAPGEAPRER
jgi:hypothetical protein